MQAAAAEAKTNQLTRHEVTVQGARIVAYESGAGLPVIYLHGAPDTHAMWLPVMARLDAHARNIAIDLPGFGESTLSAAFSLSLDNMADVVRDLLDALHIDAPVALVMTDFGAHYGMAFAAKYPERVRGLAISNANFFHDYGWHGFAKLYRVPLLGELLMSSASRSIMAKTLRQVAPALPDEYIDSSYGPGFGSARVRKTMLRMYRERDPQDFVGWEDKLLAVLKQKPSVVLWGDKDPFITPAYADRYVGAEVHHFTDNSHWLALEAPEKYAVVLQDWLERV